MAWVRKWRRDKPGTVVVLIPYPQTGPGEPTGKPENLLRPSCLPARLEPAAPAVLRSAIYWFGHSAAGRSHLFVANLRVLLPCIPAKYTHWPNDRFGVQQRRRRTSPVGTWREKRKIKRRWHWALCAFKENIIWCWIGKKSSRRKLMDILANMVAWFEDKKITHSFFALTIVRRSRDENCVFQQCRTVKRFALIYAAIVSNMVPSL